MPSEDQHTENPPADEVPVAPESLRSLRLSGTEVHYFALCPRKFWWFTHNIEQEHAGGASASVGQENVALGQLLHETAYPRQKRRDVLLDDLLRLDFTEGGVVHEIKKSRGALRATRMQLLYYLYYLKHEKQIETTGVIDFPKERRRITVALTPEDEAEIAELLQQMTVVRELPTAPVVPDPMPLCKKCAYQDLCWG